MENLRRILLLLLLVCLPARAADITQGHTFVNGETVTSSTMNAIVGSATINSDFYTAKASETSAADADVLLVYSPSLAGYRQITAANYLLTNSSLVAVLFNTSDFARRSNFLAGVDQPAISNFLATANTLTISNFLMLSDTSTRSNLVLNFWTYAPSFGTNLHIFTNDLSASAWPGNLDSTLIWNTYSNKMQYIPRTNWNPFFTSPLVTLTNGFALNLAHSLPGVPYHNRAVLVCQTADQGYAVNDEVDVHEFYRTSDQFPFFRIGCNATNTIVVGQPAAFTSIDVIKKDASAGGTITQSRWKARIYSSYYP